MGRGPVYLATAPETSTRMAPMLKQGPAASTAPEPAT